MSFLKRFGFGGPDASKPQPKSKEQEITSEEVPDDEPEDFTYREDPTQAMAEGILALEQELEESQDDDPQRPVTEVLLAKARYDQATANERAGRSQRGEADRLLKIWKDSQMRLDTLRDDQIQQTRNKALSRYKPDIGAETADQLRQHQ